MDNRPTIDQQLTVTFQSGGAWNDTHFSSAELDSFLVSARVELDHAKRAKMYATCQELVSIQADDTSTAATLCGMLDAL